MQGGFYLQILITDAMMDIKFDHVLIIKIRLQNSILKLFIQSILLMVRLATLTNIIFI